MLGPGKNPQSIVASFPAVMLATFLEPKDIISNSKLKNEGVKARKHYRGKKNSNRQESDSDFLSISLS